MPPAKFPLWKPEPINPPAIAPTLQHLPSLTRSAETIVYSILSFEYWISSDGQVREWLRHNSRLAVLLAIPAFLVLPVVTLILWQLVSWLKAFTSIAGYFIVFPILATMALLVIYVVVKVLTNLFRK